MKIGRNDPCPCGSGKKFKKCCMQEDVSPSKELYYRRLSEAYNRLFGRLAGHADAALGRHWDRAGVDEYFLLDPGVEPEQEILERQMPLFLPWLLFNRLYGLESDAHAGSGGRTIAELYAESRGLLLEALERKVIEAINRKPYTFYEVLSVEPGKRIHLQEVFTESRISVEERSGSKQLKPADLVFGRAVVVDSVGMIIGLSAYAIPPRYKPSLIEMRKRMKKRGPVTFESLCKWETETRKTYIEIDRALFTTPQLCNTDGDPLEFHKLVYDIDSAEEVFVKLAPLCVTETAEDLRRSAKTDPNGRIARVEVFWTREGHRMSKEMTNTLLGDILIESYRLTVTVNSSGRARTIRKEIESRLGEKVRFRLDEIQDARAMIGESLQQGFGRGMQEEKNPLMRNPDVRRHLFDLIIKHWESWIDEKIPALGGRTPRRMVKTKGGVEAVEALLADAERGAADSDTNAANREGIRRVRELLGLTNCSATEA